jgi:hypothetical protein
MTVTTAPEALIAAGSLDATLVVGGAAFVGFQVGTHGNTYDATIQRYARRIHSSGGGGGGYFIYRNMIEPRAIVDPKYGPYPGIIRARECLAVTMPNGVPLGYAFAQSIVSHWGFSGTQGGGAVGTVNTEPFVGFRQDASWAAGTGTPVNANVWNCAVVSDGLVQLYNNPTTVSPLAPHEFELVLDGTSNTIYWYIDGVLVGQYSPASGAAPGQVTPYANPGASVADRWNMAWNSANIGSSSAPFISDFLYRMSPFTPLLSIELAD